MPELPEVEHYRHLLLPLKSATFKIHLCCTSSSPPKNIHLTEEQIQSINDNAYFVHQVERKGKLLCLVLRPENKKKKQDLYLFLHMGMTGRISTPTVLPTLKSIEKKHTDEDADNIPFPPPHTHLLLHTEQYKVAYSDPRRFGFIKLSLNRDDFEELAPDALLSEHQNTLLINHKSGIKSLLLNQKLAYSGIGNWVADEVLHKARLHPDQNYLTSDEVTSLQHHLQHILKTAIACLLENRAFPKNWLFCLRWNANKKKKNKAVFTSEGNKIQLLKSAGRTSVIVPICQKRELRNGSPSHDSGKSKGKNDGCIMKNDIDPTVSVDDDTEKKRCRRSSRKRKTME